MIFLDLLAVLVLSASNFWLAHKSFQYYRESNYKELFILRTRTITPFILFCIYACAISLTRVLSDDLIITLLFVVVPILIALPFTIKYISQSKGSSGYGLIIVTTSFLYEVIIVLDSSSNRTLLWGAWALFSMLFIMFGSYILGSLILKNTKAERNSEKWMQSADSDEIYLDISKYGVAYGSKSFNEIRKNNPNYLKKTIPPRRVVGEFFMYAFLSSMYFIVIFIATLIS